MRTVLLIVVAVVFAATVACALSGCTYPAPFSRTLTPERKAQLVEVERCSRSYGAAVWDAYLHSTDT
jgi:FlaG/FlaF family flagellin (archaellin)